MYLGKNEAGHRYMGLHIISRYSEIHVQNEPCCATVTWCLISFSYLFLIKSIYTRGHIPKRKDKQNPTGILHAFKTAVACLQLF